MREKPVYWQTLAPVSILWAIAVLAGLVAGVWPYDWCGAEWLWCLACLAGGRATPGQAILAAAWCGLTRDVFLGPRLGSGMAAYTILAWLSAWWRLAAPAGSILEQAATTAIGAAGASWIITQLDTGGASLNLGSVSSALATGILSLVAYPLVFALSAIPSFRPWRELY